MNVATNNSRSRESNRPPGWGYLATVMTMAFFMNWHWEMAQMPAYREMAHKPLSSTVWICVVAAFGDTLMTLLAFGIGRVTTRRPHWTRPGSAKVYLSLAALGLGMAVVLELAATAMEWWSYNEAMPIIPGLRVGVFPALELTVLIPLAFGFANVRERQKEKRLQGRIRTGAQS